MVDSQVPGAELRDRSQVLTDRQGDQTDTANVDKLTPQRRSENMRRIRSKDTSPELVVRRLVHRLGFRYRLHVTTLPGKPDLVFPRLRKIIEVRGCFWHQHKGCVDSHIPGSRLEYWRPKLHGNVRRDKENHRKLKSLGWDVLIVWACEAECDLNTLADRLLRFLKGRSA
jgi:DNA mismatch endonuclease, patch repair protein